jgi:hypothetical protein
LRAGSSRNCHKPADSVPRAGPGAVFTSLNIDGDFDERGLPEPLVLAFYFTPHDDQIVQLIILRNRFDI